MVYDKKAEGGERSMKDPVCGMEVGEGHDSIEYDGKRFYFCCASCRWAFEKNPQEFAK